MVKKRDHASTQSKKDSFNNSFNAITMYLSITLMINLTFVPKENDNENILVTINNVDLIKGKYKNETCIIIKVNRKKVTLNLEKTKHFSWNLEQSSSCDIVKIY